MQNPTIKTIINEGDQFLEAAQNELFRSEEDVVPYMVCSHARQSIMKYLTSYLLKKKIEIGPIFTVEALLKKCQEVDSSFNRLNMEHMGCTDETHDSSFCNDLEKVRSCVDMAKMTKSMVDTEIWPLSKPVK